MSWICYCRYRCYQPVSILTSMKMQKLYSKKKKKKGMMIHCPLADRTKLRLLEDAMFDACEREGEEELIDELRISPSISAAAVAANPKECHQNHRGKKKKI